MHGTCDPTPRCLLACVCLLLAPEWEIGYVTDVEGNLDYFREYVRLSRVVRFADASESRLELLPGKVCGACEAHGTRTASLTVQAAGA